MNGRTIGFWLATGIVALANGPGGVAYVLGAMDDGMRHLGYPLYFGTILGVWKILGTIALLSPVFAPWVGTVKEWAYAGLFFVLSGAVVSHLAVGDGLGGAMPPLVVLAALTASWTLRSAAADPTPATGLRALAA